MSYMLSSLVLGTFVSIVNIFAILILLRCLKKTSPVLIHALSTLACFLLMCAAAQMLAFSLWIATSILAFCSSSYLFLYSVFYKSITIRMLQKIDARGGALTLEDLDTLVIQPTFHARVALLKEMGGVSCENGQYCLTDKGRNMTQKFANLRQFFGIETNGLYSVPSTKTVSGIANE